VQVNHFLCKASQVLLCQRGSFDVLRISSMAIEINCISRSMLLILSNIMLHMQRGGIAAWCAYTLLTSSSGFPGFLASWMLLGDDYLLQVQ